MAQASASSAWVAAEQARQSSIAAGEDAKAALRAATEAFTIAVTKYREEEEARRKAAVAAKQKAMNEAGARAREIYRCGQALVPCDPQGFARWCQHNEVECDILSMGDEFGAAMEQLWGVTKELTGLGELEACLGQKDFEHCGALAVDVLISAKLKALEKAYDNLKLVRRGCSQCFLAGTKVLMADGSKKNIEDIKQGEDVLATDPLTGETASRQVQRRIVTEDDKDFNTLTIASRNGPEELTATAEHPFWSPSEHDWIKASRIRPGMTLLSSDRSTVRVQANHAFTKHARTYNLAIAETHTYYVLAGATPVLVHNSGGCAEDVYTIEDHVIPRHTRGGAEADATKSLFDDGVDLGELATGSAGQIGVYQEATGNIRYFITANGIVGTDRHGLPTRIYTIVRSGRDGELVTMHPGLPSDVDR
ncbi:polymorphic toxin-type HINT domain-containing protein [Streptomyces gossypiisoli]|uniref:polymorphic toxin-type HINT domain-containing protein n=1 Tax=Streptomyces gossypiisoli TaxID=2748864 RepID=UPI0015DA765E